MKTRRFIVPLIALLLLFLSVPVSAYNTYRIRVSSGLHGSFDTEAVKSALLADGMAEEDIEIINDKTIELTLGKNSYWNPNYFVPEVETDPETGSALYYFKGYHLAGIEGQLEGAQPASEDKVFVAIYGVAGDLVPYKVHYVDTEGNTLHASTTLHGRVGDKPVVAFLHIDGYEPYNTLNYTGTIPEEGTLEFTFVYRRAETNVTVITVEGETVIVPAGNQTGGNVAPQPGQNEQGEEGGEEGPADIIDIDENETPTTEPDKTDEGEQNEDNATNDTASPLVKYLLPIGIGILALIVFLFLLFRRKDKE